MKTTDNFAEFKQIFKASSLIVAGMAIVTGAGFLLFWFGMVKPTTAGLERPRVPLLQKVAAAQAEVSLEGCR
jgi:hypothetical protein